MLLKKYKTHLTIELRALLIQLIRLSFCNCWCEWNDIKFINRISNKNWSGIKTKRPHTNIQNKIKGAKSKKKWIITITRVTRLKDQSNFDHSFVICDDRTNFVRFVLIREIYTLMIVRAVLCKNINASFIWKASK